MRQHTDHLFTLADFSVAGIMIDILDRKTITLRNFQRFIQTGRRHLAKRRVRLRLALD